MNRHRSPTPKPHIRKVIETFVLIGLAIALTVPPLIFRSTWNLHRDYIRQTGNELAAILAEDARYPLLIGSSEDARKLTANISKFPDLISAALVRTDGKVLAATHTKAPAAKVYRVVRDVVLEDREDSFALGGPEPTQEKQEEPEKIGTVRLELSMDRAHRMSIASAWQVIALLLVLMLVLGLAVTRLSSRILLPLSRLARFVETEQDLATPLPTPASKSPLEVGVIYRAVDTMRQRTAESQRRLATHADTLEQMVETRTADLVAARDEAERANRAKTLFLANVSHELRTPLQAIIVFANMDQAAVQAGGLDRMQAILAASSQLMDLIEQLLVLSRAEAGHEIQLAYSTFSLTRLVREIATTLQATLSARNTLEVVVPEPDALEVHGDRTRIRQVVFNLVRNADKFTAGGEIRLRLSADGPSLVAITIEDEGVGIAPDDLERIFTPFFQSDAQVGDSVTRGIGLGLWLSKHIAEALGGDIRVASTPGVGSTFRFTFPTGRAAAVGHRDAAALPEPPAPPPRPPGRESRILLADDERLIRLPLSTMLRQQGWIVDEASDGPAAEHSIRNPDVTYDVIILDHRMPPPQGLDLLQKCRREWKIHVPIVILTADERLALREQIESLDGQLLIKPVFPEKLFETLNRLVMGSE